MTNRTFITIEVQDATPGAEEGPCISKRENKKFYINPWLSCMRRKYKGNSTYPIPTVVPTGVVNDTKCEMSLPSVLVTFE